MTRIFGSGLAGGVLALRNGLSQGPGSYHGRPRGQGPKAARQLQLGREITLLHPSNRSLRRPVSFQYRVKQAFVRKRFWIPPLGLVVLLLGALLMAKPWAKQVAQSKAAARGLQLEFDELSLGFLRAEITGLRLRLEGVSGVSIRFQKAHFKLGLSSPRLREVRLDGGLIQVEGSLEELKEELAAWRSRHRGAQKKSSAKSSPRIEIAHNLEVEWKNAFSRGATQRIKGLMIERRAKTQRFGADLIQLSLGPLSGDIAGAHLEITGRGFELAKTNSVGASEVRLVWKAPETDASLPEKSKAPTTHLAKTPAGSPQGAPGLEKRLAKDEARVLKLLAGLFVLQEKLLPHTPPHAIVDRLWLSYLKGAEALHVGPSTLRTDKEEDGFHVSISPQGETKGTPLALSLFLPSKKKDYLASLNLEGGPIAFSTLGIKEGAFGLQGVGRTRVKGKLDLKLSPRATQIIGEGEASISGLTLSSEKLSEHLLSFPPLHFRGKGQAAVDGTHYQIENAELSLGETSFEGALDMERGGDFVSLQASIKAPLISCQALLDSAPRGLLGAVERIRFKGTFSLDTSDKVDTRDLSDMRVHWDFKNGCIASAVPPELDPNRFRSSFRREVLGSGNYPIELEFGPLSAHWTPYDKISPLMEKALLVTEDGRFFRHNGFDDRAIESSILANARAGSFVRGASTISMQLAKNVYLSRKKTLARKFQEVALTSLLEQSFEKRELLELYLNVVEFGPGVYGIRRAASHYFSITPDELSAAQCFFLASILPMPSFEYFGADGRLSTKRRAYVNRLLEISRARDGISEEQLEAAKVEELIFGRSDSSPAEPVAEDPDPSASEEFPPADPSRIVPRKPKAPAPGPPEASAPKPPNANIPKASPPKPPKTSKVPTLPSTGRL